MKVKFDQPLQLDMDKKQTAQTTVTLLSQMLGACLLSCSFIIAKLGWVLAVFAFTFSVGYDLFVYNYLVKTSCYTQAQSYRQLTERALSKKLSVVLEISIIISYFSYLTAYIIISSSSITIFIKNVVGYDANKYIVKAILSTCIIFPLCLLKSLKQLSKIAAIAGIAIFTFSISIFVYFFIHIGSKTLCVTKDTQQPITYGLQAVPSVSPFMAFLYFIMYIPLLQGNFTLHNIIPPMVQELTGTPIMRQKIVSVSVVISALLAVLLYITIGILGASMFGKDIKDNILTAFAPCKWLWVDILSLIYAFVTIIAYPLVLYPIKVSITCLCKKDPYTQNGYRFQVLITAICLILNCALAMAFEAIVAICGLFSSLAGIVSYFIIPIWIVVKYPKIKQDNELINTTIADSVKSSTESSVYSEKLEVSTVQVDERVQEKVEVVISNGRKTGGIVAIIFFAFTCGVGVYMNGADVIKAFAT
ncbi:Amino_acid transporter family protein [Hexamita inflata]|uniref:Amino acid transporter family protein n=1 Tax=Hexamita inflata TaxID=28002 RepID=A0AA86PBG7_9EUKA|nr:Amino acid transporter family protein [Hexamita inflata]CAI9935468.1 Amino acid transporter family protein [Hexamita inflata]